VTSDDDDALTAIRNIGPAMAADLDRAGIATASALRAIGAHEAYRRMISTGTPPHFIAYYVLHMALQGRPWNDCKGAEKAGLRTRFDTLKDEVAAAGGPDPDLERILNIIGTGAQR
jgi:TfoX C-terminal domain.